MPEQLDYLFSTLVDDVDARTRAPGARHAIAATRRRTATVTGAVTTAAVIAVVAVTTLGDDASEPSPAPPPSETPSLGVEVGDVPVWYDAAGLHRGHVVEQTAIPLGPSSRGDNALLTLVRTGALYFDRRAGEVWLHPWGGRPRVVGTSWSGPSGDPESDTAAWFEGDEIVVYDTAAGQEVVRMTAPEVRAHNQMEHINSGNGFLRVSSDEVAWLTKTPVQTVVRLDLDTLEISEHVGARPEEGEFLVDLYGEVEAWSSSNTEGIDLFDPDDFAQYLTLEPMARFSPDGRFLLAASAAPHGISVLDLDSGRTDRMPERSAYYAWLSWSYGHTAVISLRTFDGGSGLLLACDAASRGCEHLEEEDGELLLPS